MGSKGGEQTVGYHYRIAYHVGLVGRPIDAFLEFRAADKTAWNGSAQLYNDTHGGRIKYNSRGEVIIGTEIPATGPLTSSGRIEIGQPMLFGGPQDQGGIVGPVDVMFGEPDQMPNAYLREVFGEQTAAWRGMTTLAFCGGRFGAMNPMPQKPSYKIIKIKAGWDGDWGEDPCWYPERAELAAADEEIVPENSTGWEFQQLPRPPGLDYNPGYDNIIPPTDGWVASAQAPFGNWSPPGHPAPNTLWEVDTILWARRVVSVPSSKTAIIQVVAENGCVILINGAFHAAVNRENEQHVGPPIVYEFRLPPGNYELAIKAYDEHPAGPNVYLTVSVLVRSVAGMNPAHLLYYVRTDREKGQEPIANVNDESLRIAADRLYMEGFGLCVVYDPEQDTPDGHNERICRIIGGSFERSLIDGQWYLDLARGDYDPEALPVIGDDDILDIKEQATTLGHAVNSISVRYFDPERKEAVITPAVRALGLIRQFGEVHETLDFPEIPTAVLALRVADRELRARVSPVRAFELVTTPRPGALRRNQHFRLQSPKRGISSIVCIVGEQQQGTLKSGAIRWKVSQDVYSLPIDSYIDVEHGVDTRPPQLPERITDQRAFEAPYIDVIGSMSTANLEALGEDSGFLMTVASDPGNGLNYTVLTAPQGGEYSVAVNGEWCPVAAVVGAVDKTTTSVTLSDPRQLSEVLVGSAALWDYEVVRVDALDLETGVATLGRGCADTVPAHHPAGSMLWFYGTGAAADITEYSAGESVDVKLLTNTSSRQLPVESAVAMSVEFAQRLQRPYPPATVLIEEEDWPVAASGTFAVTWNHRNRIIQADQMIDTMMASITPPPNTRYALRFERVSDGVVLVERVDIGPGVAEVELDYAGDVRMRLWTINEDGVSLQEHVHEFTYSDPSGSSTISATAYTPVDDATIIDGGDLDG